MKKILIGLLILIMLVVAGALGANYYAQTKAKEGVDRFFKNFPEITASYGELHYSLLDRKLKLANLKLNKKEAPRNIEIQNIEISDPNLGLFDAFFKGSAGQGSGRKKAADLAELSGVKIYDQGTSLSLAKLTVTNPEYAPLPTTDPFGEHNLPKTISAVAAAKIDLEKLELTDAPAKQPVLTLSRLNVTDLQGGRIGSITAESISAQTDDKDKINIKSSHVEKLDCTKALELMAKGTPPTPTDGTLVAFQKYQLTGIEFSTAKVENVRIREVAVTDFSQAGPVLTSMNFVMNGLEILVDKLEDKKSKANIKQLGYEKLLVNGQLDYRWDAASKKMDLRRFAVGVTDAAELTLSLNLDSVDLASTATPADLLTVWTGILFKRAELKYFDKSLATKLIALAAQSNGLPPDQFRAGLVEQIRTQQQMLGDTENSRQMAEAIIAFINNPQSLSFLAEPIIPLPAAAIVEQATSSPLSLPESLNLSLAINNLKPIKVILDLPPVDSEPQVTPKIDPSKKKGEIGKPGVGKSPTAPEKSPATKPSPDKSQITKPGPTKEDKSPPKKSPDRSESSVGSIIKSLPLPDLFKQTQDEEESNDSGEFKAKPLKK